MGNWDIERKELEEGISKLAQSLNNLLLQSAGIFQKLMWDPGFTINITWSRERAGALLQQFPSRQWLKAALRRQEWPTISLSHCSKLLKWWEVAPWQTARTDVPRRHSGKGVEEQGPES